MCSVELFDHLYISRRNRQNDRSEYIILYGDHFSRIPLYTYISFNGPSYTTVSFSWIYIELFTEKNRGLGGSNWNNVFCQMSNRTIF